MLSVSCASASLCMAVGEAASKPFAEVWNDGEWSLSSPPNPTGATVASLDGVSCTASNACTAVGRFHTENGLGQTLAEVWNGSSWSQQSTANPEGKVGAHLGSISCLSANSCTAVGGSFFESTLEEKTLTESWNGTKWAIQSSPNTEGQKINTLTGVSCSSSIACTAVGSSSPKVLSTESTTLAARYD